VLLILEHTKTIVKSLILPPAGPLLLAGIGALLLGWRPRLARALLALGLASLWLLSTPIIADRLEALATHYPALSLSRPTDAQAIVILGGGGQRAYAPEYGGPAAEPYLLEKLAYGAFLANRTHLPILVTGYHVEAAAMRATLVRNFGIEPRWIDAQAYDTFENARNATRLLRIDGVRRIILLTTATHMWRAAQEFTAAGMSVVPAPVGVLAPRAVAPFLYLPDAQALVRSYLAVYELLGEPVRVLLAVTHLRRQSAAAAPAAASAGL
jgi:uncharacterized SAM-binding protein YcdF (DUF218 family)